MKAVLVIFALVGAALCAPAFDNSLDQTWESFKTTFGKTYDATEERVRRAIFEEKVEHIQKHNLEADLGIHTYTLGINKYSDLTHEEFKAVMGLNRVGAPPNCPTSFLAPSHVEVPDSVDWRKEGYVTGVKDQGQCGSCWAFSATAGMEGQWFKKTGKLVSLSEQQLVDCSQKQGNMGCGGGWMDWAFEYIKANGQETEDAYPYKAVDQKCKFDKTKVAANNTGCTDTKRKDETDLKNAVATVGPISVAIDASHPSFQSYKTGVYNQVGCSQDALDHGVTVVGYDATSAGVEYWIVKNSWGTSWGQQGYIWMSRDKNNQCGIASAASFPLM